MAEGNNLAADIATGLLAFAGLTQEGLTLLAGKLRILTGVKPSLGCLFQSLGSIRLGDLAAEKLKTVTHLLISYAHSETELAEVLEQRICPGRTVTLLILAVRRGGNAAGIYRRATSRVCHNLAVAEELGYQLHVRSLAAAGACAGELEERSRELAVLHIQGDIHEILLRRHMLHAVIPVLLVVELALHMYHLEGLVALLAGTYISAVAAAETVENVNLLHEAHVGEHLADSRNGMLLLERRCRILLLVEHEGTDGGMGTYIRALVTLDTVLGIPLGNESRHTALLEAGSALLPCAVGIIPEHAYGKQVAVLGVDAVYHTDDELRSVTFLDLVGRKLSPGGINVKLMVLAATVNGSEVHVDDVLTLLAV